MDFAEIIGGIGTQFEFRVGNSNPPSFSGYPPIGDEDQIGNDTLYLYVASLDQYIDEEVQSTDPETGNTITEIVKAPPVDNFNLFFCFGNSVKLVDNLFNSIDNYDSSAKLVERLEALKNKDLDSESDDPEDKYIYDIVVKSLEGMSKDDFVPSTRTINSKQLNEDIVLDISDIPDDVGLIHGVVLHDGTVLPVNGDKQVVIPSSMSENLYPEITFDEETRDLEVSWTPYSLSQDFASAEQGQLANTAVQGATLNGDNVSIVDKILRFQNIATSIDIDTLTDEVNNITSANIVDGSIVNSKLANNTITGAKIANNTITSNNILDGAITNNDIASNANILASKISGINGVAVTGERSGSTTSGYVSFRMPNGSYFKMAWGKISANGYSRAIFDFPYGLFTSIPTVSISVENLNTNYDYGWRVAHVGGGNVTKNGMSIDIIVVNYNTNNWRFSLSESNVRVSWVAFGW